MVNKMLGFFSEGQLSAILNHPAAKTLETRFCEDRRFCGFVKIESKIDGLKFAHAMCSFFSFSDDQGFIRRFLDICAGEMAVRIDEIRKKGQRPFRP